MDLRLFQDGTLRNPANEVVARVACSVPLSRVQGTVPAAVPAPQRTEEELRAQVEKLRTLPQPAQRSDAWLKQRSTRVTASEVGSVLGVSCYETPLDTLLRKVGAVPAFSGNAFTAWGQKFEPVAQRLYEARTGRELLEFGLINHPTIPFLGASPDGICTDGRMLEIKCPSTRVIDGNVPPHYALQMQLQLEVCDLEVCDFEECRFFEYPSMESFREDTHPDQPGRSKSSGLECGAIIEVQKPDGKGITFEYMPRFGMRTEELLEWCVERVSVLGRHAKATFWRLDQYSCVEVKRDRAWFQEALPRIEHFWREVCYYRVMGVQELVPLIPSTRKYADVLRRLRPAVAAAAGAPVQRGPRIQYLSDSDTDTESDDDVSVGDTSSEDEDMEVDAADIPFV